MAQFWLIAFPASLAGAFAWLSWRVAAGPEAANREREGLTTLAMTVVACGFAAYAGYEFALWQLG